MCNRYLLIAFILLALAIPGSAQVSLSSKIGLNFGTYKINNVEDKDYILGIVTGFGADIAFKQSSTYSFQPEVLIIQKGYQYIQSISGFPFGPSTNFKNKVKINYVEFPLLAKATVGNQKLKYHFVAGPSVAFALQGHYSTYNIVDSISEFNQAGKILFKKKPDHYTGQDAYYFPKGYNRIDFGLQIGTGLSLAIGKGMLVADIRYGIGLNHLIKDHTFYIDDYDPNLGEIKVGFNRPADMKSRSFVVSLGYFIPFLSQK